MLRVLVLIIACLVWASPTAAQDSATASERFLLGPGDVIEVSVWRDDDLTRELIIRPDGMISLPLVNEVQAAGKTVEELRVEIEKRMAEWVPDSPVSVVLLTLSSPKVYVVGKVARPGVYIMSEDMTVIQVLALAGGMTTFSDDDDILIIRRDGEGSTVLRFDYSDMEKGRKLDQNIVLNPGDTIVVP